jgi:hypothetical protein
MSERPFMQLHVSDFVGDTLQLSTEQIGEVKTGNAQFCPSSAQLCIELRERRAIRELLARRAAGTLGPTANKRS